MVALPSPNVVAALQSLRDSYKRQRQSLAAQPSGQTGAALASLDKLIGIVERALSTGAAPIASLTGALRSAPKYVSYPLARLSRGEMVQLTGVGGANPGSSGHGWWQVQTRAGQNGWIERKDLFPAAAAVLSSAAGTAGGYTGDREEIETGARDTVVI